MNLTSIFRKDAALIDLNWMQNGIVHPGEPQLDLSGVKKHNNIKPELELEWGGAGPEINLDEPAGVVERNIPDEAIGDAGKVILFARDMMNRGAGSHAIVGALKSKFSPEALCAAKKGLLAQFALEGVVGRVAVDGRGYHSCKEALKAVSRSPYKRFVRYVVGCECGDPHLMPSKGDQDEKTASSTGNPMDDFLASRREQVAKSVPHCRSTMLPLLSSVGDLDKSELDSTFVEMMNVTPLTQSVVDELRASKMSNVGKLAAAFRWIDRQQEASDVERYAGVVDASGFMLKQAEEEVEVEGPAVPAIEVDGLDKLSGVKTIDAGKKPKSSIAVDGSGGLFDDVVPMDLGAPDEFSNPEYAPAAPLDLPEFGDVCLDGVEMDQFMETEFEGIDEVPVDEQKVNPPDLLVETGKDGNLDDFEW